MANGEELLRLFGGIGEAAQAGNPYAPIQEAAQTVQNNLYGLAAKQKDGKMGEAIAAGLLTGLIGGAAQGMGNQFVGNQEALALQAMKDMQGGNAIAPNGMTRSVFNRLNAGAAVKQLAETERVKQETRELQSGLNKAVLNRIIQKDPGQLAAAADSLGLKVPKVDIPSNVVGASPVLISQAARILKTSPDELKGMSEKQLKQAVANAAQEVAIEGARDTAGDKDEIRKAKEEDMLRKEWANPVAQKEISVLVPILDATATLKKLKTPASDLALQELYQRVMTPGANAIREGVFNKITDAQNPLNKFRGEIENWMGGGKLSEESKGQLIDAINTMAKERLNYYKGIADNKFIPMAKKRGLDMGNIIPEYDYLFSEPEKDDTPKFEIRTTPDGKKVKVILGQ